MDLHRECVNTIKPGKGTFRLLEVMTPDRTKNTFLNPVFFVQGPVVLQLFSIQQIINSINPLKAA